MVLALKQKRADVKVTLIKIMKVPIRQEIIITMLKESKSVELSSCEKASTNTLYKTEDQL
jgi:hypothetical protein